MIKYLKYLISFLLIFGLTVNECSANSEISSLKYTQVSYINSKEDYRQKDSEWSVYTRKILPENVFSIVLTTCQNFKKRYNNKTLTILKLQIELYQNINSLIAQRAFLKTINTSNNQYSSLYIG